MLNSAATAGLVLDTSVWINLLATEAMEAILGALAVQCYAPEQVVTEVTRHPVTGVAFAAENHPLRQMSSGISIISLDTSELAIFLEIVGAPAPDALGDGEAAAIALAVSRGLDLVIDDRKARRVVIERFKQLRAYWTVDLIQAASVVTALSRPMVDECFAKALRFGRMYVPRA